MIFGEVFGAGAVLGPGGAKLPSTVAYFAGEIRNETVNWEDGATLVAVLAAKTASTEITSDTQISGGLWATATGFDFRDGTNVAVLETAWDDGEVIALVLEVLADGTMRLGRKV